MFGPRKRIFQKVNARGLGMALSTMQTFIFYELLAIITACLYSLGKKYERQIIGRIVIVLAILIPVFFAAFRYEVGTDYQTYEAIYKIVSVVDASETSNMYRVLGAGGIGIWVIAKMAQFGGTWAFFGIFQLLTIGFYIMALENYNVKYPFLTMYIYMLTAFPVSLNIAKQSLVMAILFYSLKYVFEKKPIKFTLLVLISTTIHLTALVYLPVYLLQKNRIDLLEESNEYRRNNLIFKSVTLFLLSFTSCFLAPFIISKIGLFTALSNTYIKNLSGSRNLSFFIQLIILIIILFFLRNIYRFDKKLQLIIFLVAVGTGVEAIGFISVVIKRVAMSYYLLPLTLLLPLIVLSFAANSGRTIAKLGIIMIHTIMFYVLYIMLGQGGITPYRMISL